MDSATLAVVIGLTTNLSGGSRRALICDRQTYWQAMDRGVKGGELGVVRRVERRLCRLVALLRFQLH